MIRGVKIVSIPVRNQRRFAEVLYGEASSKVATDQEMAPRAGSGGSS